MKGFFLALLVCSLFHYQTKAAEPTDSVYKDQVFSPDIKTILFGAYNVPFSQPVLTLGTGNQVQLSFDDISGEERTYYYSIMQCNCNWTASDLSTFDYMTGFNDNRIDNYQFSFNTLQKYTHFQVLFPDQNITITKSGNYIIKVFEDDDPTKVVFIRRFMVYDPKMNIGGQIVQPNDFNFSDTHQQVNFTVSYNSIAVDNPFSELTVVVQQNNRYDNEVAGLSPQFVQNGQLDYQYMPQLLFPGGKEFRYFDMQSLRYKGYHIDFLDDTGNVYYVKLEADEPRTYEKYNYVKDINGKFFINTLNSTQPDEESDYSYVQFRLKVDGPLLGGKVYMTGAFTDWQALPEYEMKYDFDKKMYIGNVYLKQGYYDYAYAYVDNTKNTLDLSELEGDWFQTENDYTIFVYYRSTGGRYDQLVGMTTLNSLLQNNMINGNSTNNGH